MQALPRVVTGMLVAGCVRVRQVEGGRGGRHASQNERQFFVSPLAREPARAKKHAEAKERAEERVDRFVRASH